MSKGNLKLIIVDILKDSGERYFFFHYNDVIYV